MFGLTLKNISKTTLDSELTALNIPCPSSNSRNSERFLDERIAQAISPSNTLTKILEGNEYFNSQIIKIWIIDESIDSSNTRERINYNAMVSQEQKENSLRMNNCSRPNFGKYISKVSLSGANRKHPESHKTSFAKIPKSSLYSTIEEGQSSYSHENTHQKCRKKQRNYIENLKWTLALENENSNKESYDASFQLTRQNQHEITPLVQTFDPRNNESLFDTSSLREMRGRYADSDYNKSTQRTHKDGGGYLPLQEIRDDLRTPNSYLVRPDTLSESKQDDDSDEVSSEIVLLRQRLTETEAECHKWRRWAEIQNERILGLELEICASK